MKKLACIALLFISHESYAEVLDCRKYDCTSEWGTQKKETDEFTGSKTCNILVQKKTDEYDYTVAVNLSNKGDFVSNIISFHISSGAIQDTVDSIEVRKAKSLAIEMSFSIAEEENKGLYKIDNGELITTGKILYSKVDFIMMHFLDSKSIIDNKIIKELKRGNVLSFRLARVLEVVDLPLSGFSDAYDQCLLYVK